MLAVLRVQCAHVFQCVIWYNLFSFFRSVPKLSGPIFLLPTLQVTYLPLFLHFCQLCAFAHLNFMKLSYQTGGNLTMHLHEAALYSSFSGFPVVETNLLFIKVS